MTKNERIADLERAIGLLEARITALEARPGPVVYYTAPAPQPVPMHPPYVPTYHAPRPLDSPNICSVIDGNTVAL